MLENTNFSLTWDKLRQEISVSVIEIALELGSVDN